MGIIHTGEKPLSSTLARLQSDPNFCIEDMSWYHRYKLWMGLEGGYFLRIDQLDTTQPEDIEPGPYKREPTVSALSCHHNLCPKTLYTENVLYSRRTNPYGIIAEISVRGNRRCTWVHPNGRRCMAPSTDGVCEYHKVKALMQIIPYETGTTNLQAAYEKHLNDPARKSLDHEVALMRGCLDLILKKISENKNMTMNEASIILEVANQISTVVDRMSKIEARLKMRMTPDEVMRIIESFMAVVGQLFNPTPDQLRTMAAKVESMMTITTVDIPTDPQHGFINSNVLTRYDRNGGSHEVSKEAHIKEKILQCRVTISNNPSQRNREEAAKTLSRLEAELYTLQSPQLNDLG